MSGQRPYPIGQRGIVGRRAKRALGLLVVCLLASGSGGESPDPVRPEAAVKVVEGLRAELGRALKAALVEGPTHAIDFCRLEAPAITAHHQEKNLHVGRTSDRLRNPANAPEAWMLPLLEEFRGRPPAPGAFRTVDLGIRGTGYVEPIYLKPLCVTCHGQAISPSLQAAIQERYPKDEATGYRVGEWRGLFWAVLDRESDNAPAPPDS